MNVYVMTAVTPSAMEIPAQCMSAVPMQRAKQYKINPASRNPQQVVPTSVRSSLHYCTIIEQRLSEQVDKLSTFIL